MQAHLTRRYARRFERHHVERYCVAGTPAEAVERLRAYAEAGVRHFVFNPAGPSEGFLDECERLFRTVVTPLAERFDTSPRAG
jgi:alkanesulfonate monooxygenase SsuD/methylene tetrahydromethanopterin reductase-like flavin-dependent oxidoreductase (luciferase family)